MSEAPIMPFFTDAYLADCHHLSTQAHGAYLLILLHTWRLGGKALPDVDEAMMRIVKAKSLAQWKRLRKELAPFFDLSGGTWRQKRLEKTWADVQAKIAQNRKSGRLGAQARRKARAEHGAGPADAHDPPPPPMNPSTDNYQPSFKDTGEEMMLFTQSRSTQALTALAPVLKDASYFTRLGNQRIPQGLKPQLAPALVEIEEKLAPVSPDRLKQLVMRLMTHFPVAAEKQHRLFADYASMLAPYPEDLLSAAYQHVLKHHKYHTLPKIADIIAFMEPEHTHRKATRKKLEMLMRS